MNHKFRMTCLALVAGFSMSAVTADGAQALQFTAASYPVAIGGESTVGNTHVFTYAGREITCDVKFDPIGTQAGPGAAVKVTPTYSNCHAIILGNTLPATVAHNECAYNLTVGATLAGNSAHIECGTNTIEIRVYSNNEHSSVVCLYFVASQTVGGISYSNMANDVTVATNSSVAASRIGPLATCGGATATATYVSKETTMTGSNGGSVSIDVG